MHRVWAEGTESQIRKLIENYFSEYRTNTGYREKQPDFEKIIPPPEVVKQTESSFAANLGALLLEVLSGTAAYCARHDKTIGRQAGEDASTAIRRFFKENPGVEELGRFQLQCLEETGFTDWYGWNIKHWGTKWDAYGGGIESLVTYDGVSFLEFTLETAGSVPEPVFIKLSGLFPDIVFKISFFAECWVFAGDAVFNEGSEACGFEYFNPDRKADSSRRFYEKVYGREYRPCGSET
jgi:hypothetical protein